MYICVHVCVYTKYLIFFFLILNIIGRGRIVIINQLIVSCKNSHDQITEYRLLESLECESEPHFFLQDF